MTDAATDLDHEAEDPTEDARLLTWDELAEVADPEEE